MSELRAVLADGDLRLEPLAETHREGLRAACAADTEIWAIYSSSMIGDAFDPSFEALCKRDAFAIFDGETLVGCSSYYSYEPENRAVAIGYTYIAPSVRGSGFNLRLKRLMIDHARACGIHRIVFDVDTRNKRSQAAVLKLGAKQEAVLRQNKTTWTGYLRDTAVFSLLPGEDSDLLRGA